MKDRTGYIKKDQLAEMSKHPEEIERVVRGYVPGLALRSVAVLIYAVEGSRLVSIVLELLRYEGVAELAELQRSFLLPAATPVSVSVVNDMVEIVLPIAEKYEVDMELDDEFSMPLDYLKHWLSNIYYGNDPIFG